MQPGDDLASSRRLLIWVLGSTGALVVLGVALFVVLWFNSPEARAARLQTQAEEAVAAGDFVTAVAKAKEATELTPLDGEAWYVLGVTHYRARQWQDAYVALDTANVKAGYSRLVISEYLAYTAWMHAAEFAEAGRFDEAVTWMDTAIAEDPTDANAVAAKAGMLYEAEAWERSLATYEIALAQDPRLDSKREFWAAAAAMAAAEALHRDDVAAAEAFVLRGEKSGATSTALMSQQAAVASHRREWEKARAFLLQIKPLSEDEWNNQAPLLAYVTAQMSGEATEKGDHEGALRYMQESVAATPDDAEAVAFLGHCYSRLKQWKLAAEQYVKATELAPTRAGAWRVYHADTYWYQSRKAIDAEEYQSAIDLMLKSIALNDKDARAYLNLSTCYGMVKAWEKADAAVEDARRRGAKEEDIRISREWLDAERAKDDGV
jgi:tetratricopeptide (TPR) repeat protein